MAAVMDVYFDFGGSDTSPGTEQDTDVLGPPNLKFKRADNATIDTLNPMPIPAAGINYSYWKHIYLYCGTAPATQIDNVQFYTDGIGWTGVDIKVGDEFPEKNSSSNAGYEVADDSVALVGNHSGIAGVTSAFSFTSGSTLSGPTITEAGNVIDAVGETTDYLLMQMEVINTASAGNLANEIFTFQYDEI